MSSGASICFFSHLGSFVVFLQLGLTPVLFCEDEATKKEEDKSVSAAAEVTT